VLHEPGASAGGCLYGPWQYWINVFRHGPPCKMDRNCMLRFLQLPVNHYGTGSGPWPPQGLQRAILFMVSHKPLKGPYFRRASIPYCEQVGVYLHWLPSQGEIISWYNFISAIKGRLRRLPKRLSKESSPVFTY